MIELVIGTYLLAWPAAYLIEDVRDDEIDLRVMRAASETMISKTMLVPRVTIEANIRLATMRRARAIPVPFVSPQTPRERVESLPLICYWPQGINSKFKG